MYQFNVLVSTVSQIYLLTNA